MGVMLKRTVSALTDETVISTGCPATRIAAFWAANDGASSNATTPAEPMLFSASLRDGFSFISIQVKSLWRDPGHMPYAIFHMKYRIWH
ncbi:MAG: hypothetical protein ACRD5G_09115, partial [Candidatus Acidiferrales bacterium]